MADFTRAGLRPSDWWREAVRPGAEQIETITELKRLIDRLEAGESLTEDEWVSLIEGRSPELADYIFEKARCIREREYGKAVYVRGLIECSNYCKNDCLYCGIRRSNRNASRYRLSREEILSCCENGYQLGFRTFVLQGGEDPAMTDDWVMEMVQAIRAGFPDCAITLSLGEKKYDTLKRWKEAGADRYLLRHETADACHYASLHPAEMSFEHRMQCLRDLKALGYQTGCGFMVGSPHQTARCLARDMRFIEELDPEMVGEVLSLMKELAQVGLTMVVVTHEIGFAREVASRVLFMDKGKIVEEGPPDRVIDRPANPRLQEFFSKVL